MASSEVLIHAPEVLVTIEAMCMCTETYETYKSQLAIKVSRFLCSSAHRYYAQPAITIQKAQNLTIAFRFITEVEKIPLVNIGEFSTLFRKVVG